MPGAAAFAGFVKKGGSLDERIKLAGDEVIL